MQKNHKIDLIFIVGIICLGLLGAIVDWFYWKDVEYGGFPVFSMMSIYGSYVLLTVLLIYSSIVYKQKEEKPTYVKWYMYFVLPFFMIIITMGSLILTNIIMNAFNL